MAVTPYISLMKQGLKIALGVALVAAATGAAFAAWVDNGDAMLVSMFEAGMAWCF